MTQPIVSLSDQLNAVFAAIGNDIKALQDDVDTLKKHNQPQGDANLPKMVRQVIKTGAYNG